MFIQKFKNISPKLRKKVEPKKGRKPNDLINERN